MSASVNLISQDKCTTKYYDSVRVTDNMVCAGDSLWATDACKVKLGFVCLFQNTLNACLSCGSTGSIA